MPDDGAARGDALHCERIVRSHARTFALASYFLPGRKRRAAFALYAFCRLADDMVDDATGPAEATVARCFATFRRDLHAAAAGRPNGPVFRELTWVLDAYRVPVRVLDELLDGVARDLRPVRYASWAELAVYCEGVASTVGEMCTHVFGVDGGSDVRERALRYARTLGVAMQLTNILRDVGEDAGRGRCYLPDEDLDRFGLSARNVLGDTTIARDPRWRALMQFQIARARALFSAAAPGIALLSADSRRCASACATGYAGILRAIEELDYDTVTSRARLGRWAQMGVLLDAWRARPVPLAATPDDAPALDWSSFPELPPDEMASCA
jgi:phytoene synthase